jgi:hypothetical protein
MISSVASQNSLSNNTRVRQSLTEEERFFFVRRQSWFKTFMMSNPITAPIALFSELVSGIKHR